MLIAIEGCVGVGKSTVARGLAAFRSSALLLENFESNPFLKAFYKDPVGTATETEFAFLLLHFHQLKANRDSIANGEVISDFHLGKDPIYAERNFSDPRKKKAFEELYAICAEETPTPDLLILLSSTNDLLLNRIATSCSASCSRSHAAWKSLASASFSGASANFAPRVSLTASSFFSRSNAASRTLRAMCASCSRASRVARSSAARS